MRVICTATPGCFYLHQFEHHAPQRIIAAVAGVVRHEPVTHYCHIRLRLQQLPKMPVAGCRCLLYTLISRLPQETPASVWVGHCGTAICVGVQAACAG